MGNAGCLSSTVSSYGRLGSGEARTLIDPFKGAPSIDPFKGTLRAIYVLNLDPEQNFRL